MMSSTSPGTDHIGPPRGGTSAAATESRSSKIRREQLRPSPPAGDDALSRVTFDIEPQGGGIIRLTVTHEDLERDSQMLAGISDGWPKVLSNLKTLLETGRALPR
jgi:uncharacterized protein YndB with AHSA1/START domain